MVVSGAFCVSAFLRSAISDADMLRVDCAEGAEGSDAGSWALPQIEQSITQRIVVNLGKKNLLAAKARYQSLILTRNCCRSVTETARS